MNSVMETMNMNLDILQERAKKKSVVHEVTKNVTELNNDQKQKVTPPLKSNRYFFVTENHK